MKKPIILLLSFLSVFVLGYTKEVEAVDSPITISSTSNVHVAPGATFEVDVTVTEALDLVGFQTKLNYDSTQFTFQSLTKSDALGNSITLNSNNPGELYLNYVDISTKLNGDIILFTLIFEAAQTVNTGSQDIIVQDSTYNHEFINLETDNTLTKISSVTYNFNQIKRGVYGDTNLDDSVSIADVAQLQLYISNLVLLTDTTFTLGDVNADSSISILDVAEIQLYLAGLKTTLGPS